MSRTYLLDKLDGLSRDLGFAEYTTGSKPKIDVFFITATHGGHRRIASRHHSVSPCKVRDARISAGYALVFIALLYTTAPSVGGFARVNMIETINKRQRALPITKHQGGSKTGKRLV